MAFRSRRRQNGRGRVTRKSRYGRKLQQDGIVPYNPRVGAVVRGGAIAGAAARGLYNAYRINRQIAQSNRQATQRNQRIAEKRESRMQEAAAGVRKAGVGEMKRYGSKIGSKAALTTQRLAALTMPKRVLRFSGLRTQDAYSNAWVAHAGASKTTTSSNFPGTYAFLRYNDNTANLATGNDTWPVMMINLNTTPNTGVGDGVLQVLTLSSITGQVGQANFLPLPGFEADGTMTNVKTEWQQEYGSGILGDQTGPSSAYVSPQWYDIRMMLYGATGSLTRFIVDYVELTDECYHPRWDASTAGTLGANASLVGQQSTNRALWYQSIARACGTSSIATSLNRPKKQGWKVLKSWTYDVQPNQTTDSDATPNAVKANIFIRDGRLLSYTRDYGSYDTITQDVKVGLVNAWTPRLSSNTGRRDDPNNMAKSRFLVVRATNSISTSAASCLPADTPSMDLLVRKRELLSEL